MSRDLDQVGCIMVRETLQQIVSVGVSTVLTPVHNIICLFFTKSGYVYFGSLNNYGIQHSREHLVRK